MALTSGRLWSQDSPVVQVDTMRAFGEFLGRISQDIEKIEHTRQRLITEYDSLVSVISLIKVSRELNFLRRIRLKRLLRSSEDMAAQIGKLNKVHQLQMDILQSRIRPSVGLLEKEIEESIVVYEKSRLDSMRSHIIVMLRDRSRMLRMLWVARTNNRVTTKLEPVDGEFEVKANFAFDLSDRLKARMLSLDFERHRVQFAIRLRNAYFREAGRTRLPPWFVARGWIEPWLTDRQLETSGLLLRGNEDLLVRDYKLRVERNAIAELQQRWLARAREWQFAADNENR